MAVLRQLERGHTSSLWICEGKDECAESIGKNEENLGTGQFHLPEGNAD